MRPRKNDSSPTPTPENKPAKYRLPAAKPLARPKLWPSTLTDLTSKMLGLSVKLDGLARYEMPSPSASAAGTPAHTHGLFNTDGSNGALASLPSDSCVIECW